VGSPAVRVEVSLLELLVASLVQARRVLPSRRLTNLLSFLVIHFEFAHASSYEANTSSHKIMILLFFLAM
jgi:hypothetical protein